MRDKPFSNRDIGNLVSSQKALVISSLLELYLFLIVVRIFSLNGILSLFDVLVQDHLTFFLVMILETTIVTTYDFLTVTLLPFIFKALRFRWIKICIDLIAFDVFLLFTICQSVSDSLFTKVRKKRQIWSLIRKLLR